jgi:hypothetical protein
MPTTKKMRSFRLSDLAMEELKKIQKLKNERLTAYELVNNQYSQGTVIEELIHKELVRLENEVKDDE